MANKNLPLTLSQYFRNEETVKSTLSKKNSNYVLPHTPSRFWKGGKIKPPPPLSPYLKHQTFQTYSRTIHSLTHHHGSETVAEYLPPTHTHILRYIVHLSTPSHTLLVTRGWLNTLPPPRIITIIQYWETQEIGLTKHIVQLSTSSHTISVPREWLNTYSLPRQSK